ncbi:putative translation elongation factor eef-1b gamma protein [Botrytis fragariae]|uniref:Putative translation elongation factor eef-1b gamma protein n=1 Tax=Botrytis fragariae TaxID=1964551 RepID=A0A8H6AX48_9HELO|nr:putative translation elongation factor eef-1b gamma protein [Botrytis fragariae]KAF5875187.1 putative translation elongation factor eef-1b gamma protein [Botrytis fragariae]
MASLGTVYSYPNNPRTMKVTAAAFNNKTIDMFPDFVMFETNRTPEFLTDFPLGRVPVFKDATSSFKLFESDSIAQYAAECGPATNQLLGSNIKERATIRQWISFANNEIFEPITTLIFWRYGFVPFEKGAEDGAMEKLEIVLNVLESQLSEHMYVSGTHDISLADISVAAALYWGFDQVIDVEMRGKFPKVVRWYEKAIKHQHLSPFWGEQKFVEKRREGENN